MVVGDQKHFTNLTQSNIHDIERLYRDQFIGRLSYFPALTDNGSNSRMASSGLVMSDSLFPRQDSDAARQEPKYEPDHKWAEEHVIVVWERINVFMNHHDEGAFVSIDIDAHHHQRQKSPNNQSVEESPPR